MLQFRVLWMLLLDEEDDLSARGEDCGSTGNVDGSLVMEGLSARHRLRSLLPR